MKKLMFIAAAICSLQINAQTYLISFAGEGASTTVTSVIVENLTAGTLVTLNGSQILRLSGTTALEPSGFNQSDGLKIFPNPMKGSSLLQVHPPAAGIAYITVTDINGKQVARIQSILENSLQEFRLSGFPNGIFVISVQGSSYQFTGKLVCSGEPDGSLRIDKVSSNAQITEEKPVETGAKGVPGYVDMGYNAGELLKYTVISGDYRTVITDSPSSDKTVTSTFIPCSDGDNSYSIVEIGNQVWMAENLRTTKYRNGDLIGSTDPYNKDISGETDPKYQWAYNGNESNVATYGRLYTCYAIMDSRNVCPTGWHVPTNTEWTTLENYLIANGSNYDGTTTGNKIAKSMASTTLWTSSGNPGAIGFPDYPSKRNATGYTALPGGYRDDTAFIGMGGYGFFWSSTEFSTTTVRYRYLNYGRVDVYNHYANKRTGNSVRCLQD
jgi:uncharacterized protein (TIGR02145 family)